METSKLQISTWRLCGSERAGVAQTVREDGRRHRGWSQLREPQETRQSGSDRTSDRGELLAGRTHQKQRLQSRANIQNVHTILHSIQRWRDLGIRVTSLEPRVQLEQPRRQMINLAHLNNPTNSNTGPYKTMPVKQKKSRATSAQTRRKREKQRLEAKSHSPGVPPNSCPYIDMVQTMVLDLVNSYDDMKNNSHHNPLTEEIGERAKDMLEYIRRANETLRDNSAYWYQQYKNQL